MVWKTIALKNTQFNKAPILNSFHLKNLVLRLAFENLNDLAQNWNNNNKDDDFEEYMSGWASYPLALQIKEVGKRLYRFLKKGSMPWAFHDDTNVNFKSNNKEVCKDHDVPAMRLKLADYLE